MRLEVAVLQELVDIVPGPPLRRTDRTRFLRALGCEVEPRSQKAEILKSVGDAAYELPLPPRWSEQVDVRGYVYFSSALRTEATWQHPLLSAFRETVDLAAGVIDESLTAENLQEAASSVQAHLEHVQARASRQLQDWSGPHKAETCEDEFFFNEVTEESSWENPLEVWQYDLHARYWLLVHMLQQLHERQVARHPVTSTPALPGEVGVAPTTPRFDRAAASVPSLPLAGLLGEETASAMEDTLSTSGLSAAVRSHATTIASSLISSALSFKPQSECSMGSMHLRCPPGQPPGSIHPRPPRRAPPPLRQLAAPPRVSDVPPEAVLRAPTPPSGSATGAASTSTSSSAFFVAAGGGGGVTSPCGAELGALGVPPPPPPPPSQPTAGQVVRRVAQASQPVMAVAPPPPSLAEGCPSPHRRPAPESHGPRRAGEMTHSQTAPAQCQQVKKAKSMTTPEQVQAHAARPRSPCSGSSAVGGSSGGGVFPGLLRPAPSQTAVCDEVAASAAAHIPDFGVGRSSGEGIIETGGQLRSSATADEGIFASMLETVTLEPLEPPLAPSQSASPGSANSRPLANTGSSSLNLREDDSDDDTDCPTPRAHSPGSQSPQRSPHTWADPARPPRVGGGSAEAAWNPQPGGAAGRGGQTSARAPSPAVAAAQKPLGPLSHPASERVQANGWCGRPAPAPAPRKSARRIAAALPCTVT